MSGKPKLTVFYEKLRGKVFEIDKDVTSIGRRDNNDICLKDGSLSGHHADIIRSEEDGKIVYTLKDAGSTNGTRINSAPVTEQVLKNNDLIMFGSVEVLFDSNDESAAEDTSTSLGRMTHTIDISVTENGMSTTPSLTSLNPLAIQEAKKHVFIHRIIIAVIALFGLGALAAVVIVMIKIFS